MPAVEICSERSAAGMMVSARRHVVVGQEHDLQQAAHGRVGIDDLGDVDGELDDELGLRVARRRLAGEDLDPGREVDGRVGADRVVARDRLEDVEQLALVFVDALDLHVEHRVGIDALVRADRRSMRASASLVALAAPAATRSWSGRIVRVRGEALERRDSRRARARRACERMMSARSGLHSISQRRKRDAVGLVGDAVGIDRVEVVEHRLAHQVGVQRRDAVDLVRADKGEVAHAHPAAAVLVDQRDRRQQARDRRSRAAARCRDARR